MSRAEIERDWVVEEYADKPLKSAINKLAQTRVLIAAS
jgi:hypothetical protein